MPLKELSLYASCLLLIALNGCNRSQPASTEHALGDKVLLAPLTYVIVESDWYTQLGDAFKVRSPQQRFMEVTLAVTNGGGSEVSIPLLTLESSGGQTFVESDNGEGVENWLGLIRNIKPGETQQGKVLFDVPLASYRLRLTDGAGPGAEKYAWVSVPLRIDVDTGVSAPSPSNAVK